MAETQAEIAQAVNDFLNEMLAALEQLRAKFGDRSTRAQGVIEDLVALYASSGQAELASRYRQELEESASP